MTNRIQVISPVDNSIVCVRDYATAKQIDDTLKAARLAQKDWRQLSIAERAKYCLGFVEHFKNSTAEISEELCWQMGRPISQGPGEVKGLADRAETMIKLAEEALAPVTPENNNEATRYITREPLGVIFVIAPWNYPYLTAVNAIIPALMAGNAVLLKHSAQTPLCAERFSSCFNAAGLPKGLFQYLHLTHSDTEKVIQSQRVDFVAFTGSVEAGRRIQIAAAASGFAGVGLELGGKDPAYVRADAELSNTVEALVDGAYFNSGQSCCDIKRIYVHQDLHDNFVEKFLHLTKQYQLDNPTNSNCNLGPMVNARSAEFVRGQVRDAIKQGASSLIEESYFPKSEVNTAYVAPQLLINVDHSMKIMTEETFGPVVGIMSVNSDQQAIELMNDSEFGLTASVWTQDRDQAIQIGQRVETGTWFMNGCDYLDPQLAWVGIKNSGRGCSLSKLGFDQLTRPKSYYLK